MSIEPCQPGDYRVAADEEVIEELSFPAYHRVATMIFVPAESYHASSVEMVAIDPQELQAALVPRFRSSHHYAAPSFANFGIEGN